jgi:hypothetical protein
MGSSMAATPELRATIRRDVAWLWKQGLAKRLQDRLRVAQRRENPAVVGKISQTLPSGREIAVILFVAVVVGLAVIAFLGFPRSTRPMQPVGPFAPPSTLQLAWPKTTDDCEGGRWRRFGQFRDKAACEAYVGYGAP